MLSDSELKLRREILLSFAATGAPPSPAAYAARHAGLAALEEHHVVLLREGRIRAAFPFAAYQDRARVRAHDGREWWGNCPWDGLGIVAALGLNQASVDVDGITIGVTDGEVAGEAWFHVEVPAAHWWDDIEFT